MREDGGSNGTNRKQNDFCNFGKPGRGNHPMNCVDWKEAETYCGAQDKRLPTEEEWEWAARGEAQGRTHPWGSEAPPGRSCSSRPNSGTCPVGAFPLGDAPFGIHDMAGDVWEWTASTANAPGSPHVIRGGGWHTGGASWLTAAVRHFDLLTRSNNAGFRCAR